MLKAESVSKTYGTKRALDNISFSCEQGELIGLIGQNGAGKTTLLKILAGRLAPSAGHAEIDGHDILWEPEITRPLIGYLPEKPGLYEEMTVVDQLRFVCNLNGVIREDIERHIAELADRTGITDVLGRKIGNLSKGYRQRVSLAAALAGNPEIILLDEPTTGLDPVQISEIRSLIKALSADRLVILSTHILRDLDGLCTRAIMLNQGKLIQDIRLTEDAQKERTLRVEIAMGRDAAKHLLEHLTTVRSVELLPSQTPGVTAAFITGAYDAPMEHELFQALKKQDAALMHLSTVKNALEEVFISTLTAQPDEGVQA